MKRDEDLEVIRWRLIRARRAAGLSQADVAGLLLVSRPTVSYVEKGTQRLTLELLLDLCRIYQMDPAAIMSHLDAGYAEMIDYKERREIIKEARRDRSSKCD